jgi:hypothetical protein
MSFNHWRKIKAPSKADNVTPLQAKRAVASLVPTEDEEQIKFVTWLTKQGIRHAASGNGGSRHYYEAAKLKRMGLSAGYPDLTIPYPAGGYHGLYIELKRQKGGKLSDAQIHWLTFLREQGYWAECCAGADDAIALVKHYLSLTKPAA